MFPDYNNGNRLVNVHIYVPKAHPSAIWVLVFAHTRQLYCTVRLTGAVSLLLFRWPNLLLRTGASPWPRASVSFWWKPGHVNGRRGRSDLNLQSGHGQTLCWDTGERKHSPVPQFRHRLLWLRKPCCSMLSREQFCGTNEVFGKQLPWRTGQLQNYYYKTYRVSWLLQHQILVHRSGISTDEWFCRSSYLGIQLAKTLANHLWKQHFLEGISTRFQNKRMAKTIVQSRWRLEVLHQP